MENEKIEALISQMSLDEKLGMLHGAGLFRTEGVPRLGIPPMKMSDGPMGVRNEFAEDRWVPIGGESDYVTYLPSNSAIAATWNTELAYQSGRVLGAEARGRGKDIILAPGINIKRSPLCGRNFEYMSEDPCLTARLAVPLIQGIQENDVAACVKHFALNNQETERMGVDVVVSERALREIYLPGFHAAVVEAGVHSVMCAYNRYLGYYTGHSHRLLNEILAGEWGFKGIVVSDWGAVHDTEEAAVVNMDIEMSVTSNFDEYYFAAPLKKAVEDKKIAIEHIDAKVRRILRLMDRLHMLEGTKRLPGAYNKPEHRQAAYETAAESVVLLKNEEASLPLQSGKLRRLLIIGENAARTHAGGGGSAEIKTLYEISPLLGLYGRLGGNCEVRYAQGYKAEQIRKKRENWQAESLDAGTKVAARTEDAVLDDAQLRAQATQLAAEYDDVIFIGGLNHLYDVEDSDRKDMKLPYQQDELINRLLDVNPNMRVVMCAGSPVDMSAWAARAKAIVWCWYAGCEGGHALADVLLGTVNPSGHLPETFAKTLEDYPSHSIGEFPGPGGVVQYKEGNMVGYRHFDTAGVEPLFPFGHGLSYTSFAVSRLEAGQTEDVWVRCRVENTGKCFGKAVIQLYVSPQPASVGRPAQELKAFKKVALEAGAYQDISFSLSRNDFAFFDEAANAFAFAPGEYEIRLGFSSRDIQQVAKVVARG